MTKHVQLLGHTSEVTLTYVGFDREVTVDDGNRDLRLHDGVTPGGKRFLNVDSMDERYQRSSGELDGLLGFEPNQRGQLTRLGPGDYRLRVIDSDRDSITITHGDGYVDNPSIALAASVESAHTWNGIQTFNSGILAQGGVLGHLTGDSAGHHVGPVTGHVDGSLTGDSVGIHTGPQVGNVDTRGHAVQMDDSQILLAWLSPAIIQLIVRAGLPVGSVVAFAGTLEEIPVNWSICDGGDGTPDLRDRFVIGVGPLHADNTAGGAFSHSHGITIDAGGAHAHTGSAVSHVLDVSEIPAHRHFLWYNFSGAYNTLGANPDQTPNRGASGGSSGSSYDIGGTASPSEANCGRSNTVGGGLGHAHNLAIDAGGAHAHAGSSSVESNTPPYYALYYIMKKA